MDAKVKSRREKRETRTQPTPQKTSGKAERNATFGYQSGFGNEFATEAVPGALPVGQNCAAAGAARALRRATQRQPLHRAARHQPAHLDVSHPPLRHAQAVTANRQPACCAAARSTRLPTPPNQLRWDPVPDPREGRPISSTAWSRIAGSGDPAAQTGVAVHVYAANASMQARYFYNADGELLIVPQQGRARFATELGVLEAAPGEICVISARHQVPRRAARRRRRAATSARATARRFRLPELGPIGANGLANARDFLAPVAAFEDLDARLPHRRQVPGQAVDRGDRSLAARRGGVARQLRAVQIRSGALQLHQHGELRSSRSLDLHRADFAFRYAGTANVDFAIFPPRWLVAEHTFRPPWFHRNLMNDSWG